MTKDTRHPDRMGRPQPGFENEGVRPVPPPTKENDHPTGHEQQVRRQSDTSPPFQGGSDIGIPQDEERQYGRSQGVAEGVPSKESHAVSPSNAGSQNKPTSDYERTPAGTPKPTDEKDRKEKESHGREETKDARSPDNPYGGDRRYEADFAHSGYGGHGVGSDKG